jgi:predicted 3-demethylubiquinone-9 3-methyltransferase (glyoxalase superfamily)
MQIITTNFWFDTQAEEAARFYCDIFKESEIAGITRYGKEGYEIHGMAEGTVMTVDFQLEGQHFVALNGGPAFKFNEAISFIVHCETQEEVDYFWEKLGEGGDPEAQQCGWLKDKYGVSWQIIPTQLDELFANPDPEIAERVMKAFLAMKKIDIEMIIQASRG